MAPTLDDILAFSLAPVSGAARALGELSHGKRPLGLVGPLPESETGCFRSLYFRLAALRPYLGLIEPEMGSTKP